MSREEILDEKIVDLKNCQSKNQIDSCMKCESFLDCTKRKEYVISVYQSMNEDIQNGGFNFN